MPWTLAMHSRKGHTRCDEELLRTFLRAYIELRMDESFKPGHKLKRINLTKGWLGNPNSYQVAPYPQYKGNRNAIWLPNKMAAMAWQTYLKRP